ncbi:MAG TPA: alcohol dehydrogenase catalytic domain-containing protein [Spirochaetales bacterium]|nr:alcohol dehydrogenase catalytic domain-containing protein [Spirochaetales bacterium]HOV39131.1 alcohol dehydrogenase catalytic domain-containing protein [Spirochaetales bacterium]
MKAVVKYEDKPNAVKVMDMPIPKMGPQDVLVQVKATGLCYSDVSIMKGEYKGKKPVPIPVILGHEGAGIIADMGNEVEGIKPGMRVGFEALYGCGTCIMCKKGFKNLCPQWNHIGITRDGTFAEYISIPAYLVHKLSDHVSFADAAILEPLGLVARSLDHLKPMVGESAVIIGPGSVGLLHLQALKAGGAGKVILVGIEKDRKRFEIAESLGADRCVYADKEDVVKAVLEATGGNGADIVIETASHPVVWDTLLDFAAPKARISVFGLYPEAKMKPLALIRKGITLFGDVALLSSHYMTALNWLETKKVAPSKLVTRRFPLDAIDEAMKTFYGGETVKVLFEL